MRRPLCLFGLTFVVVLVFCMRFIPMPVPDYGIWDGQHFLLEGQVYQKECQTFENENSVEDVLVLYLKSIHILSQSDNSKKIPQNQLQNIMCYMKPGIEPPIGSMVRVEGDMQCFRKATNPGEFDIQNYYRILKLDFKLNEARLKACSLEYSKFKEGLYLIKSKLSTVLDNCFEEKDASVMKAMLLGDTGNLDKEIKQLYQQSGIIHILAISGVYALSLAYINICKTPIFCPFWAFYIPIISLFLIPIFAHNCTLSYGVKEKSIFWRKHKHLRKSLLFCKRKEIRYMKKKVRELKVYDICNANYEKVPMLRLQGKWLREFGFYGGTAINVECESEKIIISVAPHN